MSDWDDRDASPNAPAVQTVALQPETATALANLATSLGLEAVRIDLAGCADKAALLARVAAALGFPAWFGANWDALHDCLSDLSWRPGKGWLLIIENTGDLRAAAPEVLDTSLAIMDDAAAAWHTRGVPLRVVVAA